MSPLGPDSSKWPSRRTWRIRKQDQVSRQSSRILSEKTIETFTSPARKPCGDGTFMVHRGNFLRVRRPEQSHYVNHRSNLSPYLLSSFPEVADACQVVRRAELHAPSFLVAYPSYQVEDLPSCLVVVPFPLGACRDGHPLEEQEPVNE